MRGKDFDGKPVSLSQYILQNHPGNPAAMWSSCELMLGKIYKRDFKNFDAEITDFIGNYAHQKDFGEAVCKLADNCQNKGNPDKASYLYNYILQGRAGTIDAAKAYAGLAELSCRIKSNADYEIYLDELFEHAELQGFDDVITHLLKRLKGIGASDKAIAAGEYYLGNAVGGKTSMEFRYSMAINYIAKGEDQKADETIEIILKDHQSNPQLGRVIFMIGESYFTKAFPAGQNRKVTDSNKVLLEKAIPIWKKSIELNKATNDLFLTHAYYYTGVTNYYLRDYASSIEYLQKVIDKWPNYQFAWSAQCLIGDYTKRLYKQGGITKEEADKQIESSYLAVVEKHSDSPLYDYALRRLGDFYYSTEQWEKAVDYYEKTIDENSDYLSRVYGKLYKAYNRCGLTDTATELRRVVEERNK